MDLNDSGKVEVVAGRQDPVAVERLLRSLPDWFRIKESLQGYVEDARRKRHLAVDSASGEVLGALLETTHSAESAEIHLLAVSPNHHRQGIGRALVAAFEADMVAAGVRVLQVNFLGPSQADESYGRTLQLLPSDGVYPT